ncbi:hypothetical protein A9Q77_06680 [Marinomonas sp. 42_23_T18]|nr:hypothetical protein A9Q77_06680 [Marinomonas sp. 42_23_T18]
MKPVAYLSSEQAYCLEQMGITRWQTPATLQSYLVHRPVNPWQIPNLNTATNELSKAEAFSQEIAALTAVDDGFTPAQSKTKIDSKDQDKTVAGLRQELDAEASVIVEDLQPIEELSVAIDVAPIIALGLPQQLHCYSLLIENKLLILSDVPMAFHDQVEVEKLAIKMAQALLKQNVSEWQSGFFNWPGQLRNPFFKDRSDWMLGALESYIEARLSSDSVNTSGLYIVLSGQNIQKIFAEIADTECLKGTKQASIASLPELYRIPELKGEAWKSLQTLLL